MYFFVIVLYSTSVITRHNNHNKRDKLVDKGRGAVIDSSYRLKNLKFDDFRFPYRLKL